MTSHQYTTPQKVQQNTQRTSTYSQSPVVVNKNEEIEKAIVIPLEDGSSIKINLSISIERVGEKVDIVVNDKKINKCEEEVKYRQVVERPIMPFPIYNNGYMTSSNKDFVYEKPMFTRPTWIKRTFSYNEPISPIKILQNPQLLSNPPSLLAKRISSDHSHQIKSNYHQNNYHNHHYDSKIGSIANVSLLNSSRRSSLCNTSTNNHRKQRGISLTRTKQQYFHK